MLRRRVRNDAPMRDTIRDDGFFHAVMRMYPIHSTHPTLTRGRPVRWLLPRKKKTAGSNMDAVFDPTCHAGTNT